MRLSLAVKTAGLLAACCGAFSTHAATIWDEAVNGDFSNDGLAPTAVALAAGANTVLGVTGNPGTGVDRDYFSFVVPDGMVLQSIILLPNTSVVGGVSFFGMQPGSQVTVNPTNGAGAAALMARLHYDNAMIGSDLLSQSLLLPYTAPLSAGTYSIWVQELDGTSPYGLQLNVAAVPLPVGVVLLFSGLLGLGTLGRWKLSSI